MTTAAILDEYAARYQQAYSSLAIAAEAAAVDAWLASNTLNDDDWLPFYWVIVLGSASQAADLAAAYTDAQLDVLTAWRPPSVPVADLGWLEPDFAAWGATPTAHARWLVSEGMTADQAIVETADKVSRQMTSVLRAAENNAIDQILNEADEFLVWDEVAAPDDVVFDGRSLEAFMQDAAAQGYRTTKRTRQAMAWRRIPQGGACGWCRVVADRLYTDASARAGRAWHNYCRCTWRLVTPDESREWKPTLAGDAWREVIKERADVPTTQGKNNDG